MIYMDWKESGEKVWREWGESGKSLEKGWEESGKKVEREWDESGERVSRECSLPLFNMERGLPTLISSKPLQNLSILVSRLYF